MKIVLFGTGDYYNRYKEYFRDKNVICLLSNNVKEKEIDGYRVRNPLEMNYDAVDSIYILVKEYDRIIEQLYGLGVEQNKIKTYNDIQSDFELDFSIKKGRKSFDVSEIEGINNCKKVLIITHDFSLTGVPIALLNLIDVFEELGYSCFFIGLDGGTLVEKIKNKNIYYYDALKIHLESKPFEQLVKACDLVVIGTFSLKDVGIRLQQYNKFMIWWCHESLDKYYEGVPVKFRNKMDFVCGVGKQVIDKIHYYYPNIRIYEYPYFLPAINQYNNKYGEKVVFAVIGTIEYRKAQDVVLKAVNIIKNDLVSSIQIYLIGKLLDTTADKDYGNQIISCIKDFPCVEYLGEKEQDELASIYEEIDVLICPSRNDPMPIVVSEALQRGILCVVSTEVGQTEYINNGKNGFVFENESAEELAEIMMMLIKNREEIYSIGQEGKEIYYKYFEKSRAKEALKRLLNVIENQ